MKKKDSFVQNITVAISLLVVQALILGLLAGIQSGCALTKTATKAFAEMTLAERSTWMMDLYYSQYSDYMITLGYEKNPDTSKWEKKTHPVLTEEKLEILKNKKQILTEVWPLIKIYDAAVVVGKTPDVQTEQEIIQLLEDLLLLL
jgi:hypothetical protein